ncbi:MAG: polysaccharide deacetylase family protein [Flavobacteriaceae bacterium]
MRFPKTPKFVPWLFPKRIWAFSSSKNTVYLTFDDGPIPEVTPWVLEQLNRHQAKATFFCIGENITKHPNLFQKIIKEGHAYGNHTYNHLKGTQTSTEIYLSNVKAFEEAIQKFDLPKNKHSLLFRPPYGKLTQRQAKLLQKNNYKLVMWEVLSYDWDAAISSDQCLEYILKNIQPGSIVVFHDSLKAEKNLKNILPKVLEFITEKGWEMACIPS